MEDQTDILSVRLILRSVVILPETAKKAIRISHTDRPPLNPLQSET
ncbi:Uncharacterized protein dnm_029680 [Desulfonema magnum]|uniref:Uncharacterized protein n=1 Tax=Desulfonema magnum TaxID=45655 RepID=A0A975BKG0_9BACT|nr:Uncharacterized protein dnm_029680 [Desulfonema magnum]